MYYLLGLGFVGLCWVCVGLAGYLADRDVSKLLDEMERQMEERKK